MNFFIFSIALMQAANAVGLNDQRRQLVQRRFFNKLLKNVWAPTSVFELRKLPIYNNEDKWICSDGREVLMKDILKGIDLSRKQVKL